MAEEQEASISSSRPAEFLLEEYRHCSESFMESERIGERRVEFLLSVSALYIGALSAVIALSGDQTLKELPKDVRDVLLIIGIGGYLALILFGLITLEKILKRNASSDRFIDALNKVREFFIDRASLEGQHLSPYVNLYSKVKKRRPDKIRHNLFHGGLAHTVALLNCSIIFMAVGLFGVYVSGKLWPAVVAGGIAALALWVGQVVRITRFQSGPPPRQELRSEPPQ